MGLMDLVRVLLLSDTHLGLDWPWRPRVQRRRRGAEFFANFERALAPARRGEVDVVVHGGDLLYRSRVPNRLVEMAFAPLRAVADRGVPVFLVPGNHERSHVPHGLWALHANIHVFDRPRAFVCEVRSLRFGLCGFPFCRAGIRESFPTLLDQTGLRELEVDVAVLCLHECIEGARVGPHGYVFRRGHDVLPTALLPEGIAAVLAGHIHRHQVLREDLRGRPLVAPVVYAGSSERTSLAERDETKGYLVLHFAASSRRRGALRRWTFHPLPSRPMFAETWHLGAVAGPTVDVRLARLVARYPRDAIVQVRIEGKPTPSQAAALRASAVRHAVPLTMNVTVRYGALTAPARPSASPPRARGSRPSAPSWPRRPSGVR